MEQSRRLTRKVTADAKKGMRTRVLTGAGLVFYALLIILFSALSSLPQLSWFSFNDATRAAFFAIFVLLLAVLAGTAGVETSRLIFKRNRLAMGVVLFSLLLIVVGPIVPLGLKYYTKIEIDSVQLVMFGALMLAVFLSSCALFVCLVAFGLRTLRNTSTLLFLVCWIGIFFFCICYLSVSKGWPVLLLAVLIPLFADSFAYFGGTLFGIHKMAPTISPKKTWEGAIIAIVLTTGVMCLVLYAYMQDSNHQMFTALFSNLQSGQYWPIIVCGVFLLTCFSIVGDLLFSYIKRRHGIKDFSAIFPGHGGVLDRADSLSFVVITYTFAIFVVAAASAYYAVS